MVTESQKELLIELAAAGYITHQFAEYFTRGALTRAEANAFIAIVKKVIPPIARVVGRGIARAPGTVGMLAMRHPYVATAAAVYVAYDNREAIQDLLSRGYVIASDPSFGQPGPIGREPFRPGPAMVTIPPAITRGTGRAVSKANKAVKQAMTWLKTGGKGVTGSVAGKLPKGAFRTAVKASGMANPNTPSRVGKGKSIINKIARRLKKWW